MNTYTVLIEAGNNDHTIWQAMDLPETVTTDDTADEFAKQTADHQNIAEGSNWRVRVWNGADADTATEPDAEHVAHTCIDDFATFIAERHGIDSHDAAVEMVTALVDEDDEELWDSITSTLTPAGVEVVTRAVDESYSVGAVATRSAQILVDLEEVSADIDKLTERLNERIADRDKLVRKALGTELRRDDIATAARVKPARLYQIRDGRR